MARGQDQRFWQRFERPPLPVMMLMAAGLVAVIVLAAVALTRTPTPPPSGIAMSSPELRLPPEPTILAGNTVLFVGDSWTAGYGASDPATKGFVPLITADLALNTEVVATSGAGYAHVSPSGKTIAKAIADSPQPAPDLVVMMAGVNDAGEEAVAIRDGVRAALEQLRSMYPDAVVMVLGPMPPTEKSVGGMKAVSQQVGSQVTEPAIYENTLSQGWLPVEELPTLIDPMSLSPTDAGHRRIADRLFSPIALMLP
jgi:lysophospholipase L1-like esterase